MELALVTAAPFALALLLALPGLRQALNQTSQTLLSSLLMLLLFLWLASFTPALQAEGAIVQRFEWIPSLGISLSFYLDGLSLLFALIISGIGALVFFYAGFYFDDAAEHNRFIVWLLAFAGAMLAVVLAGNLFFMFVAWELTSVTSFALIGFKGKKDAAAREGAFKALFVTGGGALALIIGLVMLAVAAGQLLEPAAGFHLVADYDSLLGFKDLANHGWFPLFAILILLGGFTKSAQFPFHFWLPGAMSAPTPASAYLHSATMVKAGIYLFARLSPVMYGNQLWSAMLLAIGLITMLIGAYFAVNQRDLKALLAYSTASKLGAIVALIGLPGQAGLKAAFVGIIAHALYKSALFLVAGTIDHATGTRRVSRLGGLRTQMPVMFWVTVVSALSMAGLPFLMGFVAKETLLEVMGNYDSRFNGLVLAVVGASAAFTAMAGYMLIYDVFLRRRQHRGHFHAPPGWIRLSPALLAIGSLCLGFLLEPLVIPLLELAVPKQFELYLFAGFNSVFWQSMAILVAGLALFLVRRPLIKRIGFPLSGDRVYAELMQYLDYISSKILQTQTGNVQNYLVVILLAVAFALLVPGGLLNLLGSQDFLPGSFMQAMSALTITDLAKISMLALAVASGVMTVYFREHLKAAIAYGVLGYAIGVIFLIEHAPDVALVQLLVETMATVLIIYMLGRIRIDVRNNVISKLWEDRNPYKFGIARDLVISALIGLAVFIVSLTALQNREDRGSISEWHLRNTAAVNTEDVVGAIVADFRATDTLMEIAVFATAALGVLTLLARGRGAGSVLVPRRSLVATNAKELSAQYDDILEPRSLSTPFTRSVSHIVLPVAILIGIAQILYGGVGPGDGFTAGVTIGLAISLWNVVFGYAEAKRQLPWFKPEQIVRLGLLIAIANALLPLSIGGAFMGHVEYDKLLGIYDLVGSFGLHVTSALIFEIAIAITVMGGLGIIIEAIAYARASSENGLPGTEGVP